MAVSFWHSSLPGWNQSWIDNFEQNYGYDPARAKELLIEAEVEMGAPLDWSGMTYVITPRPELAELEDVGEAIWNYWKAIGADLELDVWEFERFRKIITGDSVEVHHNDEAWTDATIRFPDPATLRIIYYSGGCCHFFESETIDRVYEELQLTTDPAARDALMREAVDHIYEEYGTLPLFWLSAEFVLNPAVVAEYKTSGLGPHANWSTSRQLDSDKEPQRGPQRGPRAARVRESSPVTRSAGCCIGTLLRDKGEGGLPS